MPKFTVTVVIENRPGLSDPEGETILKDLILKGRGTGGGDSDDDACAISEIRTAKMLRMTVDSADAESAAGEVRRMCDDLHLYNPVASSATVKVVDD